MNRLPPDIPGLAAIAAGYDCVICDVWGVLHNGQMPTPSAVDALKRFRVTHGPVVLLTNAPRLAADVRMQLNRIGVSPAAYDAIITSGEAARRDLAARIPDSGKLALYNLGPPRDRATYEGLKLRLVDAGEADLVLCTGLFNDETEGPDDYAALLERFKARGLLFLCANPDLTVRRGDDVVFCAGAIAQRYEEMGGKVLYFGKPYAAIFDVALAEARRIAPARRPLIIGDGLGTDIRGANAMGWDALFVTGGLVGAEIGSLPPDEADARLAKLFETHGVHARARLTELRW